MCGVYYHCINVFRKLSTKRSQFTNYMVVFTSSKWEVRRHIHQDHCERIINAVRQSQKKCRKSGFNCPCDYVIAHT